MDARSAMMKPIRVAIVGADLLMRELLAQTLPLFEHGLTCAAELPCDEAALQRCREQQADLVVFDLNGRGGDEWRVLRELGGAGCRWALLIIVGVATDRALHEWVLRRGCGLLSRACSLDELARAAVLVALGGTYLDAELHAQLAPRPAPVPAGPHLSQRERHVLQLVAEGHSTKEVATILRLSTKTVDKYRTTVMQKLDVHDVVKLTHCAIRMGFVTVAS